MIVMGQISSVIKEEVVVIEKLRDYFDDMVVFKDLKNNSVFSSLGLPSFTRDWLLRKFEDDEGNFDISNLLPHNYRVFYYRKR